MLTGTIEAMALYHGLFINVGNYWFAFVAVAESDWPRCYEDFHIGDVITVKVWKVCCNTTAVIAGPPWRPRALVTCSACTGAWLSSHSAQASNIYSMYASIAFWHWPLYA